MPISIIFLSMWNRNVESEINIVNKNGQEVD